MTRRSLRVFGGLSLALFAVLFAMVGRAAAQPGPGPEHKIFEGEVGMWDAAAKVWETPDAEPMTFTGSETNELLGGMWLVGKFSGQLGDVPFSGLGTTGYDPAEKKYIGTWIDSVSPYLTIMKGDYDAATKTLTMTGGMRDVMTGKVSETKQVWHTIDADTRTFEIHSTGPDGKMFKMMEIKYTRSGK